MEELIHVDIKDLLEELRIVPKEVFSPLTEVVINEWLNQLSDEEITDKKIVRNYETSGPLFEYYVVADGALIEVYHSSGSRVTFIGKEKSSIQKTATNFLERVTELDLKMLLKKAKKCFREIDSDHLGPRYDIFGDDYSEATRFYDLFDES